MKKQTSQNSNERNIAFAKRMEMILQKYFSTRKEFYEYLGMNHGNFSGYMTGRVMPTAEKVLIRFDSLGINRRWLLYGEEPMMQKDVNPSGLAYSHLTNPIDQSSLAEVIKHHGGGYPGIPESTHKTSTIRETSTPNTYKVKLVTVPLNAGAGYSFTDIREGEIDVDVKMPDTVKAYIVSGDSMFPSLPSGTMVFVDLSKLSIEHNDLVAVVVDGIALCKRFKLIENKKYLCSDNPDYEPIHINGFGNYQFIGKIIRSVIDYK